MRKRVLLIDDSMTIHKIVELTLDHGGFELFSAFTADEGLKLAQEHDPHIVLVDNKLCQEPTFLPALASGASHLGIIMLFGAYEKFPETEISSLNVQDYLIKPFNANALNHALTAMADSAGMDVPIPENTAEEEPAPAESVPEEPLQEIIEDVIVPPAEETPAGPDAGGIDIDTSSVIDDPLSVIEQDIEFEILESHIDKSDGLPFSADGLPADGEDYDSGNNIVEAEFSIENDMGNCGEPREIGSKPTDTSRLPAVDSADEAAEPIPMPPRAKDAHLLEKHEPIAMGHGSIEAVPEQESSITVSPASEGIEEPGNVIADIYDEYESVPTPPDIMQPEPPTEDEQEPPAEELSELPGEDPAESVDEDMLDSLYSLLTESAAQDEIPTERDMPDEFTGTSEIDELREEIVERQELMEMFNELDDEIEHLADSFEREAGQDADIPSGFRRLAELAGADSEKAVPVKNDTPREFTRAGRLTIDLSKEELADLLMRSVNTADIQNMIKEAMQLSLEQTMEKVVREEIKQLKGEE